MGRINICQFIAHIYSSLRRRLHVLCAIVHLSPVLWMNYYAYCRSIGTFKMCTSIFPLWCDLIHGTMCKLKMNLK